MAREMVLTLPNGREVTYQLIIHDHIFGYGKVVGSALVTTDMDKIEPENHEAVRTRIRELHHKPELPVYIGRILS